MKNSESIFSVKQIMTGGLDHNFSYLVIEKSSGESFIVDPCGDSSLIFEAIDSVKTIKLRYILLTHGHRDHTDGVAKILLKYPAKVAAHPNCSYNPDTALADGQKLPLGSSYIECIYTPGHSSDSVIYHLPDDSAIFTGDTLFIDYCGFCEPHSMFKSLRERIYPLADGNIVYSGHDYGRVPCAPLGEEKIKNPYLSSVKYEDFVIKLKEL